MRHHWKRVILLNSKKRGNDNGSSSEEKINDEKSIQSNALQKLLVAHYTAQ